MSDKTNVVVYADMTIYGEFEEDVRNVSSRNGLNLKIIHDVASDGSVEIHMEIWGGETGSVVAHIEKMAKEFPERIVIER